VRFPADSLNCRFLGNYPFGAPNAVALDDARHIAFCGSGGGVYILDVSDPTAPRRISDAIRTAGEVRSMTWDANRQLLYITLAGAGLEIWDVTSSDLPVRLGGCRLPGPALDLAIDGDYAYIAAGPAGLCVLNVSNPADPEEIGHAPVFLNALALALTPGLACVVDDNRGLKTVDISDPRNPQLLGHWDSLSVYDVAIYDHYACLAGNWYGLRILDIQDPRQPRLVGGRYSDLGASGVAVSGHFAFTRSDWAGIEVTDISDPARPVPVTRWIGTGAVTDLFIAGPRAYVVDDSLGLIVLDVGDLPRGPRETGHFDSLDCAEDVALAGDLAYVAGGFSGLDIVRIAEPGHPVMLGSWATPDYSLAVAVSGQYAFIGEDQNLYILDVSDSTNPILTGQYVTSNGTVEDIKIVGNLAYLAEGDMGLGILNISNPANPQEIAHVGVAEYADGIAISGNYVFVADQGYGVDILDVSDPGNPQGVAGLETDGDGYDVAVTGEYLLLADGCEGVRIWNVADPWFPVELAHYTTWGGADAVGTADHCAYVADEYLGLVAISVGDTARPRWLGSVPLGDYGLGIAGRDSAVCVAAGTVGLRIINMADPFPGAPEIGRYRLDPVVAHDVVLSGRYAYVAAGDGGLEIIDVTEPPDYHLTGKLANCGAWAVAVSGNHAYVASEAPGLIVADVSDPTHPFRVGDFYIEGGACCIAVADSFAYVGSTWGNGLYRINVADPAHPIEAGRTSRCWTQNIAIAGHCLYVVGPGSGLVIHDIGSSVFPESIGSAYIPYPRDVSVLRSRAYVLGSSFSILDVSNPAHPRTVANRAMHGNPLQLVIAGTYAYVATADSGLRVIDFSDTAGLRQIAWYITPGQARGVAADADRIYVADGEDGLQAYQLLPDAVAEAPARIARQPAIRLDQNPVADGLIKLSIDRPASQPVEFALFDLTGRRVARFALSQLKPGRNHVKLSVRDLSSGIYFLVPEGSLTPRRLKLVIARPN
jgi:hypothetical protein